MRLRGVAADDDPFEHLVRIFLHQDAVVERARLALVGIDAHVDRAGMVLRQEGPLQARGKPRAAAAAQIARLDHFDGAPASSRPAPSSAPYSRRWPRTGAACGCRACRCWRAGRVRTSARHIPCDLSWLVAESRRSQPLQLRHSNVSKSRRPFRRQIFVQCLCRPACRGEVAAPRHSPNSSVSLPSAVVSPGLTPGTWHMWSSTSSPPRKGTADRAANPGPRPAVRLVLLEEAVED